MKLWITKLSYVFFKRVVGWDILFMHKGWNFTYLLPVIIDFWFAGIKIVECKL